MRSLTGIGVYTMNIESQQQFFTRNCPKCGKEIKIKNKYQCKYLDRDKKLCRSCANRL